MEGGLSEQHSFVPQVNISASEEVKKPRLGAVLFCEYATLTEKGTYVLAGCFERLLFAKDDQRITSSFFLYVKTGETKNGEFQVTIIDPNDKIISAFSYEVDAKSLIPGIPASLHFLKRIQFHVPVEGVYWFNVSFSGESLGGAPLMIEFSKEEAEDEHTS